MLHTNIYPEEQPLRKYCAKSPLQLIVIQSMVGINEDSFQCFTNFLTKILKTLVFTQEQEFFLGINNYTSALLEKLRITTYAHLIKITFWVLIPINKQIQEGSEILAMCY